MTLPPSQEFGCDCCMPNYKVMSCPMKNTAVLPTLPLLTSLLYGQTKWQAQVRTLSMTLYRQAMVENSRGGDYGDVASGTPR